MMHDSNQKIRCCFFVCQKDETQLLKPWLAHALAIVDRPDDIHVLDNGSSNAALLNALKEAERCGVDVCHLDGGRHFLRKHRHFEKWVMSHASKQHDTDMLYAYIPMDCDEFLALEEENIQYDAHSINACKFAIKSEMLNLVNRDIRNGICCVRVPRVQSITTLPCVLRHTPRTRNNASSKLCLIGKASAFLTLRSKRLISCRGYHNIHKDFKNEIGAIEEGHHLVAAEFRYLPHALRVERSSAMLSLKLPRRSRIKYEVESRMSEDLYLTKQLEELKAVNKAQIWWPSATLRIPCLSSAKYQGPTFQVVLCFHKRYTTQYLMQVALKRACRWTGIVYSERHVSDAASKSEEGNVLAYAYLHDTTIKPAFPDLAPRVVNGKARNISKRSVDEAMQRYFGRSASIDPVMHTGHAWEKSNQNCDILCPGRIVQCPLTEPISGCVYQRILGRNASHTSPSLGIVEEYCLYVVFDEMFLVRYRFKTRDSTYQQFQLGKNAGFDQVPVSTLYDGHELENLKMFIKAFHLDFGRLDIMLDQDGIPFIIDVNDTPAVGIHARHMLPQIIRASTQWLLNLLDNECCARGPVTWPLC